MENEIKITSWKLIITVIHLGIKEYLEINLVKT